MGGDGQITKVVAFDGQVWGLGKQEKNGSFKIVKLEDDKWWTLNSEKSAFDIAIDFEGQLYIIDEEKKVLRSKCLPESVQMEEGKRSLLKEKARLRAKVKIYKELLSMQKSDKSGTQDQFLALREI